MYMKVLPRISESCRIKGGFPLGEMTGDFAGNHDKINSPRNYI